MKIKTDSRKVKKGDTFVALKTLNNDGHEYIEDAIKNGATTIVAEHGLYEIDTLIVKNTKDYLIKTLKEEYYDQIKELKLIGITGTNGKTTECFLTYEALIKLEKKVAYIGTIGFYVNGEKIKDLPNTTPEINEIYEMLLFAKENEVEYVLMEVSSHALSMGRVEGLEFSYAVFTNLTKDHLDYHLDMKSYALAKQKLFRMSKKAIVNIDDDYKNYFLLKDNNNITYGFEEADYQILDYEMTSKGSDFVIKKQEQEFHFQTSLLGKHNVYNVLVTIILLLEENIDVNKIQEIIPSLKAPSGRMDTIFYDTNRIIIDYAHTPDAVGNILKAVKELKPNHIYTIVGCGGNRDKTKRPEMAKMATNLSTLAIFTSDNPRLEDPNDILDDMINNLENTNYEVIVNRKNAIIKGIQMLENNDILLVLGKGHETYQIIGKEKLEFDDKQIVLEII
ncbi:MAG: UDP-N-acetylmuramoyl-L-alanyl-D-glutamate--2,6-diaminopimelate ligase [Bacilli bacterium]|jgi:UDP-N-acetylmuramoyl-L-alanyl-D-glutamate--2,6-diaminopimelate ligase|nr:UDP-N-acetylmuramoyl-L-alanyl-D-glutamate--2,6-diaminopimelate ligase [Bacilli bacterium]